jgi:hypothetical protein
MRFGTGRLTLIGFESLKTHKQPVSAHRVPAVEAMEQQGV